MSTRRTARDSRRRRDAEISRPASPAAAEEIESAYYPPRTPVKVIRASNGVIFEFFDPNYSIVEDPETGCPSVVYDHPSLPNTEIPSPNISVYDDPETGCTRVVYGSPPSFGAEPSNPDVSVAEDPETTYPNNNNNIIYSSPPSSPSTGVLTPPDSDTNSEASTITLDHPDPSNVYLLPPLSSRGTANIRARAPSPPLLPSHITIPSGEEEKEGDFFKVHVSMIKHFDKVLDQINANLADLRNRHLAVLSPEEEVRYRYHESRPPILDFQQRVAELRATGQGDPMGYIHANLVLIRRVLDNLNNGTFAWGV